MSGQAPVCGLFGRRGVGKSTLARQILRHQGQVLVWDYMGEHGPLAFRSEGNLQALAIYLNEVRVRRELTFAARYIPRTGEVAEFEAFCRLAYRCRNAVIVIEEVAAVCSASYLPPEFGRIVRQGRHRGLGLLWCTQRLNEVSRTLTSLTDLWAGFSLSEPADLLALSQRCAREYAERVAKLPRFEWLGYEVDDQATKQGCSGCGAPLVFGRMEGKSPWKAGLFWRSWRPVGAVLRASRRLPGVRDYPTIGEACTDYCMGTLIGVW